MGMSLHELSRRAFLALAAATGLLATTGCPRRNGNGVKVFRRSGRGRHVSNAAKKHNANRLYATEAAAMADLPHPGDPSVVVSVIIHRKLHSKLFPGHKIVADLRRDL